VLLLLLLRQGQGRCGQLGAALYCALLLLLSLCEASASYMAWWGYLLLGGRGVH
jgi:hypothetical protein